MGKFRIKLTEKGYVFRLNAANGVTIAVSEIYETLEDCRKGIESLKRVSAEANFEDQTVRGYDVANPPKFEILMDNNANFRFRLRDKEGKKTVLSQGYTTKQNCLNGMESIRKNAENSEMIFEN